MIQTTNFSFSFQDLTQHLRVSANLDFTIIFNNRKYSINKLIACSLSNKIFNLCLGDCLCSNLVVNTDDGPFEIIQNYLLGNPFNTTPQNYYFCLHVAAILEIDSLFKIILNELTEFDWGKISLDFCIAFNNHSDVSSFLPIISQNFQKIYNLQLMVNWPAELFDYLFRYKRQDASVLIPIVEKFLAQNPNTRLLKYYSLSADLLGSKTTNINLFRNHLLHFQFNNRKNLKAIEYKETDKFAGIFNRVIRPTIKVNTYDLSFCTIHSSILLDDEDILCNHMAFDRDNIIDFSFKTSEMQFNLYVTGYVIKTWNQASSRITPISWRIEVSSDASEWAVIDERYDQFDMISNDSSFYYKVYKEDFKCKFIRFIQIKNGTTKNNDLAINRFEIFGKYSFWSE